MPAAHLLARKFWTLQAAGRPQVRQPDPHEPGHVVAVPAPRFTCLRACMTVTVTVAVTDHAGMAAAQQALLPASRGSCWPSRQHYVQQATGVLAREFLRRDSRGIRRHSLLVVCHGDDFLWDELSHALAHAAADVHNHLRVRCSSLVLYIVVQFIADGLNSLTDCPMRRRMSTTTCTTVLATTLRVRRWGGEGSVSVEWNSHSVAHLHMSIPPHP